LDPSRNSFRIALALTLAFFLLSSLTLPLLTRWRGDERFYTDAAIRMVQTGDYLTPYESDGSLRFNKPVLNYWLIAGSYHLFGINVFAGRIAQLVAGTLALLAVYRLALLLFDDRDVALLTLAAMMMNEPFLNASIRATTDVVQYALLALALSGFVGLLFRNRRGAADYLCAYGGLALAALTKGGMAILLLLFVAAFAALRRRRARTTADTTVPRISVVVPWYCVLLAIAPLAIWLALNLLKYGRAVFADFYGDQVGGRLGATPSFILENLLAYGTGPFVALFPWVILLLFAARGRWPRVRQVLSERRAEISFAVGWFLTVAAVIIPGNITRTRYLLPTYPMLAAVLAYALVRLSRETPAASKITGIAAHVVAFIIAIYGLLLIPIGARLPHAALLGALAVTTAGTATWWFLSRRPPVLMHWVPVALLAVAAYRLTDVSIRSHLFAIPVHDVIRQLDAHGVPSLATVGLDSDAAHVRLISAGRIPVTNLPPAANRAAASRHDAILVPAASPLNPGPSYRSVPAGVDCDRWRINDLARFALGQITREDLYARRGHPVRLLIRRPSQPPQ
jgi:4-amino-4-deoxy-L-arabinose transferase-like glycosyltransferase